MRKNDLRVELGEALSIEQIAEIDTLLQAISSGIACDPMRATIIRGPSI